jgi:8-oxo-dGTP pyrophosphatase MutT (NUDIX family)
MARRIDYYDDPDAPKPNSVVPAAVAIVVNDAGEILVIRRTDNGNWALPGGAIEMTESVAGAAVRETFEETGVQVEVTGLLGIYTDPGHVIRFTSNDEVRREFSVVLTARPVGGEPTPSSESSEVRWVAPAELAGYAMGGAMRKRVDDYLKGAGTPVIA